MTEQTPLERLDEAFNGNAPHHELYSSAIAYRDYAEARIKELEAENSKLKSHDCWKEVTGG